MKTIAFFNNKGGVGKTSLVYHLAWMFADLGIKTLAVDLDPQANLTAMFLNEDRLERLWGNDKHPETVYGAVLPILNRTGDITAPNLETITENLQLMPGDLDLYRFEDKLSDAWPLCRFYDDLALSATTAFNRLIRSCSVSGAEIALIDIGPSLGAINRSALIASDYVCFPLVPDLFSLQGLKNLGPTIREWRSAWNEVLANSPVDLATVNAAMEPIGYIILQHGISDKRPAKAYRWWMDKIPEFYREAILDWHASPIPVVSQDDYCLSLLKHYKSLMPMAIEARKPIFHLKSADGAVGAHAEAVRDCYLDFQELAKKIATRIGTEQMVGEHR